MKQGFVKVAAGTPEIRVADPAFNAGQIVRLAREAAAGGAKLLALPELCITGYSCGDLFLQLTLLERALAALRAVCEATASLDLLLAVGLPVARAGRLYNCAAVLYGGRVLGLVPKTHIPNYAEFYEKRWFAPGTQDVRTVTLPGLGEVPFGTGLLFAHAALPELVVGVEICEDLWVPCPPSTALAVRGATVLLNLSASDELVTKDDYRRSLVSGQSARLVCGYVYADAGAGESTQDVVYAGHDLICENGALLAESRTDSGLVTAVLDVQRLDYDRRRMGTFTGDPDSFVRVVWGGALTETALERAVPQTPFVPDDPSQRAARCEKILGLQAAGLARRVRHTHTKKLVVGVSGGLDSTLAMLVCARTLDSLGMPRSALVAVTMPCFGTTARTRSNAEVLAERLGAALRTVDITESVRRHFADIGHDEAARDVVYENAQARERTQVLMDIANGCGGLVVGTGDLSELALGWATYNGDHMSMYGVNAGVPKTLVRHLVQYAAETCGDPELDRVLTDILATPVSPELLPAEADGSIAQKTEDLVGPYLLHDFYLYYAVRWGFGPEKVLRLAEHAFRGTFSRAVLLHWLRNFYRRFFAQQFKRSCLPDGPKVGTLTLSPRGDWRMPSDASAAAWLEEVEGL